MSASPKRKKPKLGSAARQWVEGAPMSEAHPGNMESGPKAELKFKSEVDYAIWRAVCGKPSPWLIDPEFMPAGTFEEFQSFSFLEMKKPASQDSGAYPKRAPSSQMLWRSLQVTTDMS
jgi:hypothetical protein